MFVGLIAARPLSPQDASARAEGSALLELLPAIVARVSSALAHAHTVANSVSAPGVKSSLSRTLDLKVAGTEVLSRRQAAEPKTPVADVKPVPARIPGDGPWMRGQLIAQTERLDLYVGNRTFSADQVAALAPLLEQLLRDDEAHFGTVLQHRVSLGFYRVPPKKGVRGMAYTDTGRAELFYRPEESPDRAATIVAHELGHHLEAQRYGEGAQRRADTILHEGMATWIAGDRWLAMCGATSWKQRARQLRNAGIPLRLLNAERSGADNAYELWASFVDFLAQRYGWDKLDALYRSGRGRAPGSSNYQKVLGKSIEDLADEWRAWLDE
jgi:hypothetical protein